jgi:hypothetical protein
MSSSTFPYLRAGTHFRPRAIRIYEDVHRAFPQTLSKSQRLSLQWAILLSWSQTAREPSSEDRWGLPDQIYRKVR